MWQFYAHGCASLLQDFIDRKPYTTGVPQLDEILIEGEHRMILQELIMKYLIWLGIKEDESYDIIKKIAKKKFKEAELAELKGKLLDSWDSQVGTKDHFEETWKVVEDAARYSFNSSHALSYAYDSIYGAYLKSHYPLEYYTVVLNLYQGDFERTNKLTQELNYFKIKMSEPKFRYSFSEYSCDKNTNMIYKGISSIKGLSKSIGEKLRDLKDKEYLNFLDLLKDCKEKSIGISDLTILIKLDYFSEFGKIKKLLHFIDIYTELYGKKLIKKDKEYQVKTLFLKEYCAKETDKQYSGFDYEKCLADLYSMLPNEDISIKEKMNYQVAYYGYVDVIDEETDISMWFVTDIETRGKNKFVSLYRICDGAKSQVKCKNKVFEANSFAIGDILQVNSFINEGKWTKDEEGKWIKSNTEFERFLSSFLVTK